MPPARGSSSPTAQPSKSTVPEATKAAEPAHLTIDGVTYDVTDFVRRHPGGPVIMMKVGPNQDATDVFYAFHERFSEKPRAILRSLPVVKKDVVVPQDISPAEAERRRSLAADLAALRKKSWADGLYEPSPIRWFVRLITAIFVPFGLGLWIAQNHPYLSALLVGFAYAQIGFLMHDSGHRASFSSKRLNVWAQHFLFGFMMGGSARWWNRRHNKHHTACNDEYLDPDLKTTPLFAWHESLTRKCPRWLLPFQHVLFYPALLIYMTIWHTAFYLFEFRGFTPTALYIPLHHSVVYSLLWWINGQHTPILFYLGWYWMTKAMMGVYLGWAFSLNHFTRPLVRNVDSIPFAEAVAATTQNVRGPAIYHYFTGYLGWQIEHHLYPNMPVHNYYKIAPQLRAVFAKHGIEYVETTPWAGTIENLTRLQNTGRALYDREAKFFTKSDSAVCQGCKPKSS